MHVSVLQSMEWTKDQTLRLIQAFKERESLWNSTIEDYKDRAKKVEAWKEIAEIFHLERSDVERKMRNLIGQFQRELKRNPAKTEDEDDPDRSKWFAFRHLLFLKHKPRVPRIREIKMEVSEDTGDGVGIEEFHYSGSELDYESSMVPSIAPKSSVKRKRDGMDPFEIIESSYSPAERDECQIFGEYVSSKIRKLRTEYAKNTVQHLINAILYDAFLGKYDAPPTYDHSSVGTSPRF